MIRKKGLFSVTKLLRRIFLDLIHILLVRWASNDSVAFSGTYFLSAQKVGKKAPKSHATLTAAPAPRTQFIPEKPEWPTRLGGEGFRPKRMIRTFVQGCATFTNYVPSTEP